MLELLPDRLAILDIETTGLDPETDQIIELAVVFVDGGKVVRELEWLVRPTRPVPALISALTGLTDEALAGAASFDEQAPGLRGVFEDRVVVAHNAAFERSFLPDALADAQVLDSCELALILFPELPSHALDALVKWAGRTEGSAHRALADARDTLTVMQALLERACEPSRRTQLIALARNVQGPMKTVLERLATASFHAPARVASPPKPPIEFVTSSPPTPRVPTDLRLPAELQAWARRPSTRALEIESASHDALIAETARLAQANLEQVWVVSAHARMRTLELPRLAPPIGHTSKTRLSALLERRVVLDPVLANAMAYLDSWRERTPGVTAPSSFWRDRVPLYDAMRTLLSGPSAPPGPGVFVGSHHDVTAWLEAGVRPHALIWLDAPHALDQERRRLSLSLDRSRLERLPSVFELAAPGRPLSAELRAVATCTRALGITLEPFTEPAMVQVVDERWATIRAALEQLSLALGRWHQTLRDGPLISSLSEECARLQTAVEALLAGSSGDEIWVSLHGLSSRPRPEALVGSIERLIGNTPTLFVSDVRRNAGWAATVGAAVIERAGRAEALAPVTIVDRRPGHDALSELACSIRGPLTIMSGEPLTEPLVAALASAAARVGRQVRTSPVTRTDVRLIEWWGAAPVPRVEGSVVWLQPGDPLGVRRLATAGVDLRTIVLRGAFDIARWAVALDGLPWLHADPGGLQQVAHITQHTSPSTSRVG